MGVMKSIRTLTERGETSRRPRERYSASDPSTRATIAGATENAVAPKGMTTSRSSLLSRRGPAGTNRLKAGSRRKQRY